MSTMLNAENVSQAMSEVGLDFEAELLNGQMTGMQTYMLPQIRIEHRDNDKHQMYIDPGDSYLDDEEPRVIGTSITGVVFAEQSIRAMWQHGETLPVCSSINDKPNVESPVTSSCRNCPESLIATGKCRPKMRVWLLIELDDVVQPVVMHLSPTSLKHWDHHKARLWRSGLPVVAVNTVFTIVPVKRNGFSYAEVAVSINKIADKAILHIAKQARDELQQSMWQIGARDYTKNGDKIENQLLSQ